MKFLDQAKIYVKSGAGGKGCVAFHREKYVEFGGPDGGNGGRGGDVIFEAANNVNTLIDYRYQQHHAAGSGRNGAGKLRSGENGKDLILYVPVGTEILDDDKETVLYDLTSVGQRIVFLKGGDGGFGNAHYKSSTNQAPRHSTPGYPAQEREVLAAVETHRRCRAGRLAQCREIHIPRLLHRRQTENRRLSFYDFVAQSRRRQTRRQSRCVLRPRRHSRPDRRRA